MSDPISVASSAQWQTLLSSNNVVVADFYADWCGPCKMIAPVFASLAREHTRRRKIDFAKVNVDHQPEIASLYNVTAMPTFIFFHHGQVIRTLCGANPPQLREEVSRALQRSEQGGPAGAGAGFRGEGKRLGGQGVKAPVGAGGASFLGWLDPWGILKAVFAFVGLYFWTLFSIDPYKAAENSPFNPERVQSNKGTKEVQAGGAKKAPSAFRTLADLGKE